MSPNENARSDQTAKKTSGVPAESPTSTDSSGEKQLVLCGFKGIPVYRLEDTDGEDLQHNLAPKEPPPLANVAKAWGLTVRYVGCSGPYFGMYRHYQDRAPEITLASHDEQVFFHELAHASQYRVWKDIHPSQRLRKEVAAELAACALARMYGRQAPNEGASYEYIKAYVEEHQKCLSKVLVGILADTEQIIKAIIEAAHVPHDGDAQSV